MNDQIIQCIQSCTVTVRHEFVFPLLSLSVSDGVLISSAILLVWGVGWGFRVLIQTLKYSDGNQSNEE